MTEYSNRNILIGIFQKCQLGMARVAASVDLREIGKRIRALRGNLRQEELANELGISQGQLSKIERGMIAPTLDVLARLGARFTRSIDWIVCGRIYHR